jgi:hypothetical protein
MATGTALEALQEEGSVEVATPTRRGRRRSVASPVKELEAPIQPKLDAVQEEADAEAQEPVKKTRRKSTSPGPSPTKVW